MQKFNIKQSAAKPTSLALPVTMGRTKTNLQLNPSVYQEDNCYLGAPDVSRGG